MNRNIAICIATYRRHDLLSRLLESIYALEIPEGWDVEVRLVDNDAEGSAKEIIEALPAPEFLPDGPRYVVEPKRGIADARNAALEMGPADFVLFVDDDEIVPTDWLTALVRCQGKTDADVILGPVTGRLPKNARKWMTRGGFFNKEVGPDGTELDWRSGRTSNTLVAGRWFFEESYRFDSSFGRSGGSDSHLFHRLAGHGATFAACDSARVFEDVEPERASIRWLLLRNYRNGLVYQRVAQEKLVPARALWRVTKAAWKGTTGLPLAIEGRPERTIRGGMLLALAYGGVVAWLRPQRAASWVEYGERAPEQAPTGTLAASSAEGAPLPEPPSLVQSHVAPAAEDQESEVAVAAVVHDAGFYHREDGPRVRPAPGAPGQPSGEVRAARPSSANNEQRPTSTTDLFVVRDDEGSPLQTDAESSTAEILSPEPAEPQPSWPPTLGPPLPIKPDAEPPRADRPKATPKRAIASPAIAPAAVVAPAVFQRIVIGPPLPKPAVKTLPAKDPAKDYEEFREMTLAEIFDDADDAPEAVSDSTVDAPAQSGSSSPPKKADDDGDDGDDEWEEPVGWQIPLVDLALAIARHLKVVLVILALTAAAVVYLLSGLIPEYTASSIGLVLPRDKSQFDASIATGSLETSESSPRSDSSLPFTLPPNVDLYVLLMKSRSTLTRIADQFESELIKHEGMPRDHRSPERASFVRRLVKITGNEDGMITVTVTSKSAQLAADLANAFVDASEVDSREIERKLLEDQAHVLQEAADAASIQLEKVRVEYADFSGKYSLLEPSMQAAGVVDGLMHYTTAASELEAEIQSELTRFREDSQTISALKAKLAEIRDQVLRTQTSVMDGVSIQEYGRIVMDFRRLSQLLEFRQDLVLILSSQAEIFRIRAEQASGPVVVVRPASVPSTPSGPSKRRTATVPLVLGVILSLGWAVVSEQTKAIGRSPEMMGKVNEIQGLAWKTVPYGQKARTRWARFRSAA